MITRRNGLGEHAPFEFVAERFFIQEDPRITELFVKPIFDLLHASDYALQIAVACQHNEGRVCFARKRIGYRCLMIVFLGNASLVRRFLLVA